MSARVDSPRVRAAVVGTGPAASEALAALERHGDVEIVASGPLHEAARTLHSADVDAVLLVVTAAEPPFADVAALREQTDAPVILLVDPEAQDVLEHALEAGVSDVLLLPQPPQALTFAIRKAIAGRDVVRSTRERSHAQLYTVFSPKGGTGKSATAVNLAVAISRCEGLRTLLVDFDLQFGDCAVMLGLQPDRTIHDLAEASGELDVDKLAGYTVRHPASGIDLVAASRQPEQAELVPAGRLVRLLEVAREAYDAVVVDTAPFLGGPTLTALDQTDVLLLLSILDVPTLKDVRQSLETLELISFPRERTAMLLNRADAQVGLTRAEVESALGQSFDFALPEDRRVPLSVNRSIPVLLAEPRSDYARAMREVAGALLARGAARGSERPVEKV